MNNFYNNFPPHCLNQFVFLQTILRNSLAIHFETKCIVQIYDEMLTSRRKAMYLFELIVAHFLNLITVITRKDRGSSMRKYSIICNVHSWDGKNLVR